MMVVVRGGSIQEMGVELKELKSVLNTTTELQSENRAQESLSGHTRHS